LQILKNRVRQGILKTLELNHKSWTGEQVKAHIEYIAEHNSHPEEQFRFLKLYVDKLFLK